MREMTVDSIRVSLQNYQRVVILREQGTDRLLPIWIGPAEADAIAIQLQQISVPRPLTHDLLRAVIQSLGAKVHSVVVTEINNDTFYARIFLTVDGRQIEIDSRPSDALALAVRVQAPIYAEEAVLQKAGMVLDQETGKVVSAEEKGNPRVSEEERRKLSVYKEFFETLNLEDLGGSEPPREPRR